jgi:hypothetical protein
LEDLVKAYPEAKFILTTREPNAWLRSLRDTIGKALTKVQQFPASFMQYFDHTVWRDLRRVRSFRYVSLDDSDTDEESTLQTYDTQFVSCPSPVYGLFQTRRRELLMTCCSKKLVRELIPSEKLLEVELEDELRWEQICPFLDTDIPDVPFPNGHDERESGERPKNIMRARLRMVVKGFVSLLMVPVIGIGTWYYIGPD